MNHACIAKKHPLQACICLKAFLLPLLIPRLRCVRPLRSCSLNTRISGSSPPFSMPAPNLSTPFRVSFKARFCLPGLLPTSSSPSSSPSPSAMASDLAELWVGTQETWTDPSLLWKTFPSWWFAPLVGSFARCRCRAEADRRWPKGASLLAAAWPELVDGWCWRGTRRRLTFVERRAEGRCFRGTTRSERSVHRRFKAKGMGIPPASLLSSLSASRSGWSSSLLEPSSLSPRPSEEILSLSSSSSSTAVFRGPFALPLFLPPRPIFFFCDLLGQSLVDLDLDLVLTRSYASLGELVHFFLDHLCPVLLVHERVGDDTRRIVQLEREEVTVHVWLEGGRANKVVQTQTGYKGETPFGKSDSGECMRKATYLASSARDMNL